MKAKAMKATAIAGVIIYSPNPEKAVQFYRHVIGIPFELQSHGKIREHYECLFNYTHVALLKRKEGEGINSIVPSFRVDNLREFIAHHELQTLHPIIDLGEGKCVSTVSDIDGNMIRLIQMEE
jgi:predicted enzyme related to lactoylglutathione lyase